MGDTSGMDSPQRVGAAGGLVVGVVLFAILFPLSRVNYLLFHSLVEMVAVLVAFGIFVIAWNTRRIASNPYLLVLGVSQLFVGAVLLLHALAYKGMGVFAGGSSDLATQLWIVARILAAFSFLAAGIALRRPVRVGRLIAAFGVATCVALATIFVWRVFPAMYVDGVGLTPLKIAAEYGVVLIAATALWLLWRDRERFERRVGGLLAGAILAMIAAELAFTLYLDVYGALNFLGHYLALASLLMVYMAVITTALVRPYSLLFFELERRAEAERQIADTLQSGILTAAERVDSLEVGHAHVSATALARVGGDFYDLFAPADGVVAFVLGDVCGKGIEAATSTTMVRTTLRGFTYCDPDPASVLSRSNESLAHQFASDKFATVVYGTLETATGRLRLASAGHPDPILCRNGVAARIEMPRNPPLSVCPGIDFDVAETRFEDGDTLVLYTDGLEDAGRRGDAFGAERVLDHVGRTFGLRPPEIAKGLLAAARHHAGDAFSDDVEIVVLRYTAPAPAEA